MVGQTLSHYDVLSILGDGGMGVVYKARDKRLERVVALKVLHSNKAGDPDRKRRFMQEARAASALNHPNIAAIYDIGEEDGRDFIVMEYVEGQPLDRRLERGPLSLREALKYGAEIASALARAHAAGIIHRDLKPGNVLITDEGSVKLVDFGLAKLTSPPEVDDNAETRTYHSSPLVVTQEGVIAGTAAYMSPEQAEGRPLDVRTDIFSLGAVLYEMFTGRRAFQGRSPVSTLAAILHHEPAPVSEIVPGIPREVERLISRCLRKNLAERFQHMGDVALALLELKQESDSGQLQAATATSFTLARSSRVWMIVAALVIVAAALSILPRLWRTDPGPPQLTFKRLTDEAGPELSPSLSPDGNSFVYSAHDGGNWDIYLRRVDGSNAINLTAGSDANNTWPAFSPDGSRIAFQSSREGGGIFVMGATGESVRRVTELGEGPTWSPDGKSFAFTNVALWDPTYRAALSKLWVVDLATGSRREIPVEDAVQASWSPHGHRIAYYGLTSWKERRIWTVSARAGDRPDPVPATAASVRAWDPVWSPDGRYLYFASLMNGSVNLWRVAIDEKSGRPLADPQPATKPSPYSALLCFSADGKRLAYAHIEYTQNIASVGFDPAAERITGEPVTITSGGHRYRNPAVSPDGKTLAYASDDSPRGIFLSAVDGSGVRHLTEGDFVERAPMWMPDGNAVVFYSHRHGAPDVWAVNIDGSGSRLLVRSTGNGIWFPSVSPDGRRLSSYDPSAGGTVVELRSPGSKPVRIPNQPESGRRFWPMSWSPDGRLIALAGVCEQSIMCGVGAFAPDSGKFVLLSPTGHAPMWLPDSRRLLFHDTVVG